MQTALTEPRHYVENKENIDASYRTSSMTDRSKPLSDISNVLDNNCMTEALQDNSSTKRSDTTEQPSRHVTTTQDADGINASNADVENWEAVLCSPDDVKAPNSR